MMVISPDEGGTGRAVYFANMLGLDMGMFYKRRDYTPVSYTHLDVYKRQAPGIYEGGTGYFHEVCQRQLFI